jgi:hypothetical protein
VSNLQPIVEAGPTSFPDGVLFLKERKKFQNPEGVTSKRAKQNSFTKFNNLEPWPKDYTA